MKNDLPRIKKMYGEEFAKKFCRPHFSHLMEREDFSFADFLTSIVAPSRYFYEDLIANHKLELFKNAIWGLFREDINEEMEVTQTPEQLMKKAGYTLYKCETYEDMLKFQKYYAKDEELCTYEDSERINTHTIFWAVKDNVDKIKRENFTQPRRQDEYGTSVISLQFTKGFESTVSIINRYNTSVEYGDATFSNDLEQIQKGLTESFKKYYGINLVKGRQKFELPGYIADRNGVFHKYNYKIKTIYYCANNTIIVNGEAKHYDPTQYVIADCYVIDRKNKTIDLLEDCGFDDTFIDQFHEIKKIDVTLEGDNKIVMIYCKNEAPVELTINKHGQIIKLLNNNVEKLGDGFMRYNTTIEELSLDNVEEIGDDCLMDNETLKNFDAQNLVRIGDRALSSNKALTEIEWKNISEIGDFFLMSNEILERFISPKLEKTGRDFLFSNKKIEVANYNRLKIIQQGFMHNNTSVIRFYAPLLNKDKYGRYLNARLKEAKKDNIITKMVQTFSKLKSDEDIWDLF